MSDLASFVVSQNDDIIMGVLSGGIDLSNASELERAIVDAVPNTALGMVLDLSELTYVDSSGIRLLLSLAGKLRCAARISPWPRPTALDAGTFSRWRGATAQ